jgi:transposase
MDKVRGTKDSQETKRLLIVDFINSKKGTHQQASDLFHVSKSAVDKIWTRYKASGIRGIKSKKRGVQEGKKINGKQSAEVCQFIKDNLPDQLKLAYGLWTREAVQQLILDRYGIELSRWQVGRYVKSWGYTPQKPITKAFEQKPEKVKAWLETEYPAIKKRASKENAIIYFGDETGMRSDHQAGRSDAPAGKTPVIKKTDQPFSLNMISALSNHGHLQFMIMDGRFNSEVFQTFLLQMIKYSRRKIFFVTDGHPAHKTKKLNEWLSENSNRIEVFFLPPYSPELSPQEHVN